MRNDAPQLDFVLVTGLSGAGKSLALSVFEDAGYFCVDNLPSVMINGLAELFLAESPSNLRRIAIVSDVRGGEYFTGLADITDQLRRTGVSHRIVFLDAADDVLVRRFKETRRRHPLAPAGEVLTGILKEREMLAPLRERADLYIDTSELPALRLRQIIAEQLLAGESEGKLGITFTSFGFKYGGLRDADLTFDVRFLPNPYYEPALRALTGLDEEVREFVNSQPQLASFYDRLFPLLEWLLPAYLEEGKAHLTVGVGCTGGRHRSVVIAEHLARTFAEVDSYRVGTFHRDAEKPQKHS